MVVDTNISVRDLDENLDHSLFKEEDGSYMKIQMHQEESDISEIEVPQVSLFKEHLFEAHETPKGNNLLRFDGQQKTSLVDGTKFALLN
jgi:hypothetical protein